WVLFKQKKYEEAKKYLLEAVKQEEGQHAEILDHLGDVYLALGEKAEAIAAWKKAIEAARDTKREQARKEEVEKKLKAHQERYRVRLPARRRHAGGPRWSVSSG